MKKTISNKIYITNEAQEVLTKKNIQILLEDKIIKSNIQSDIANFSNDVLTKRNICTSDYIGLIIDTMVLIFTNTQKLDNTQVNQLIGLMAFGSMIYSLHKLLIGTSNIVNNPDTQLPIKNTNIKQIRNTHEDLILKYHKGSESAVGVYNNSKESIQIGTFFPYYGMIETLSLETYETQLRLNKEDIQSAVKIFEFNKNNQTYITITKPEVTKTSKSVSLLYFCNSNFTENNQRETNYKEKNAIFTQYQSIEGIKAGLLITKEVLPDEEILVPGNFKH